MVMSEFTSLFLHGLLIGAIFFQLMLILIFIREFLIKRVELLGLIILGLFLMLVNQILLLIFITKEDFPIVVPIGLSLIFSLFIFVRFVELFEKPQPGLNRDTVYSFLLGFASCILLLVPLFIKMPSLKSLNEITDPSVSIAQMLGFIALGITFLVLILSIIVVYIIVIPLHIILSLIRIKHSFKSEGNSSDLNYVLMGFVLIVIGNLIGVLLAILDYTSGAVIGYSLVLVGQLFIAWAFLSGKSILFSAHRLDNLILVAESGIVLFNYEFPGTKAVVNKFLIGGVLTAIMASIQEMFGSQSGVKEIRLGEMHISIKPVKRGVFMLISAQTSTFITQTFNNFVIEFEQRYKSQLASYKDGFVDTAEFDDIKQLVEQFFVMKGNIDLGISSTIKVLRDEVFRHQSSF